MVIMRQIYNLCINPAFDILKLQKKDNWHIILLLIEPQPSPNSYKVLNRSFTGLKFDQPYFILNCIIIIIIIYFCPVSWLIVKTI